VIVKKAYKYRFYPTREQKQDLARNFGGARLIYNYFLNVRTEAWQQEKKSINYHETASMLTKFKKQKEVSFLNEVSSQVLQQSLRDLEKAFTNFFKKRSRYPKFKKKSNEQSIRYSNISFKLKGIELQLAKQKSPLDISWDRKLPKNCKIVSATVSKDCSNRYFISIICETNVKPLRKNKKSVGIDVGLKDLAILSDGTKLENPKFLQEKERTLKIRQRRLSRKVKGSKNRNKARLVVAKVHAGIKDARTDFIHKFTTKVVRENQAIFVEGLAIANRVKNYCLAKSISNAAWGMIFGQLEYKSKWYGRTYLELDRFFPSSKMCSKCGHILESLTLKIREWDCPKCLTHHDRDFNASKNIKIAGEYLLSTRSGAGKVTPTRYERELINSA